MTIRYSDFKMDRTNFDAMTGFLEVDATIARVGVQLYMTADGVKRELRPESEVSRSADTFKLKPLTLEHPMAVDGVTSKNYKDVNVGTVPNIVYSEGLLNTDEPLVIQEEQAIEAATTTHQQLSAGYLVDLVEESGVWEDTFGVQGPKGARYEYDSIQTNIRANHVALVERGRAGEIASLKFDSEDDNKFRELLKNDAGYEISTEIEPLSTVEPKIEHIMPITIDGKEYNETQVVDLFHKIKNDHKSALEASKSETAGEKQRADLAEGKLLAAEKVNAEQAETIKTLNSDEDIQKEIAARMDAWLTALPILELDKADYSLSVADVNKLVVTKLAPEINLDNMSAAVIQGIYVGLLAAQPKADEAAQATKAKKADDGLAAFQAVLNRTVPKADTSQVLEDGISTYEEELAAAWNRPTSNATK